MSYALTGGEHTNPIRQSCADDCDARRELGGRPMVSSVSTLILLVVRTASMALITSAVRHSGYDEASRRRARVLAEQIVNARPCVTAYTRTLCDKECIVMLGHARHLQVCDAHREVTSPKLDGAPAAQARCYDRVTELSPSLGFLGKLLDFSGCILQNDRKWEDAD